MIHIFDKKYVIKKLSTENNELYGSVKPTEISMILEKVDNVKINPSLIQPLTEIKSLGNFKVTISLHSEVETNIVIETALRSDIPNSLNSIVCFSTSSNATTVIKYKTR